MSEKTSEKKPEEERELTREEYFEKLGEWLEQMRILQNATACFPYYLASTYPTYFTLNGVNPAQEGTSPTAPTAQATAQPESATTNTGTSSGSSTTRAPNPDEGYEFNIAPLWKRFFAEMVDVVLLLLLKVAITFTLLNVFDLDLSYEFDSDYLKKTIGDDDNFLGFADLLTLSTDLFLLEILMKVFVCLYEAIWTMNGRVFVGGATPGKLLLRLRIVYVEVLTLPNGGQLTPAGAPIKALIYPAANPGFTRALMRAVAKNLVLSVLFPVCFVLLFLKNNRTFYDVLTKTVVVEENAAPILRRR